MFEVIAVLINILPILQTHYQAFLLVLWHILARLPRILRLESSVIGLANINLKISPLKNNPLKVKFEERAKYSIGPLSSV